MRDFKDKRGLYRTTTNLFSDTNFSIIKNASPPHVNVGESNLLHFLSIWMVANSKAIIEEEERKHFDSVI